MKDKVSLMTGLDLIEKSGFKIIKGHRIGLVVNPATVNRNMEHAADLFGRDEGFKLVALFGPQHGIYGTTQDNMIEWSGFVDERFGVPVYSLYGEHRKPTQEMLEGLDALVLDLPDIGARYYTFVWTAKLCMEACAEKGIRMILLDRPNPINGVDVEGPLLNSEYRSFVGLYEIPIRHGMTLGEMLLMMNEREKIGCDLYVVRAEGWKREQYFDDADFPWVLPSPNMPTIDTAVVYPGFCLLEATMISEGRGTCRPFEINGAPYVDPHKLKEELTKYNLEGVFFRPLYFEPTFNKHKGQTCGGLQLHVTDRNSIKPVKTATAFIMAVKRLWPGDFEWKAPPYEYEYEKMPIDILWGDSSFREAVETDPTPEGLERLEEKMRADVEGFIEERKRFLLY